jgi:hypothetical protein
LARHHPSDETHKDYKKHGDGINDPNLVIDYDPLFSSVLGTGVNRRELLKWGSLGALAGLAPTSATFAQEKKWDPTVRIGYIPITDAAACWLRTKWVSSRRKGWSRHHRP